MPGQCSECYRLQTLRACSSTMGRSWALWRGPFAQRATGRPARCETAKRMGNVLGIVAVLKRRIHDDARELAKAEALQEVTLQHVLQMPSARSSGGVMASESRSHSR